LLEAMKAVEDLVKKLDSYGHEIMKNLLYNLRLEYKLARWKIEKFYTSLKLKYKLWRLL